MPKHDGRRGLKSHPPATQSRGMSLMEAMTNVVAGYGIAVLTQSIVFPMFGLWVSINQNLQIGAIFTAVSIMRTYSLRRLFEAIRVLWVEEKNRRPARGGG